MVFNVFLNRKEIVLTTIDLGNLLKIECHVGEYEIPNEYDPLSLWEIIIGKKERSTTKLGRYCAKKGRTPSGSASEVGHHHHDSNLVQFESLPSDDPNGHISNFLEICDTFKHNGVIDDAIRLRLFPFSLRDKAKARLNALPTSSITTWDDLAQNFLAKFFPLAKIAKMRNDITSFMHQDSKSLYEAWERYKELLLQFLHHRLPKWLQVQTFYNGLIGHVQTTIDAVARGALMAKSIDEAYDLLEEMAINNYQ
ncbi:Retrotransposon gag domain - like 10 [Theobroma cacao]|nr:Retrotransposon gag domain - like 10 [Theobroma cacao]